MISDDLVARDKIVVSALLEAHELNREPNRIDCSNDEIPPDEELINALEVVLAYFMPIRDFLDWKNSLERENDYY